MRRPHLGGLLVGVPVLAILACASPASAAVSHVVVSGDSLSSIAYANGISTESLASYNGLGNEDLVIIGQTISVPSAAEVGTTTTSSSSTGAEHVVVSGDSLSSIAYANGISISDLASFNGLSEDDLLIIGQTISVPSASGTATTSTSSASEHVVVSGESLSSIAYANGISISDLASYNGLSEDDLLLIGQTVSVPAASGSTATSSTGVPLGSIESPSGTLYLESNAASNWNSMRQASLDTYGVDIYPGGPLSAYRTYDQQAELYQQYLDGVGPPAAPPGTSEHNLGTAVDLATEEMRSVVDSIGGGYGWGKFTAPDEWWHVSFVGG